MINLARSRISTSCNSPLYINSAIITNNSIQTSNISTKFTSALSLSNYITLSNGSNAAQDLSIVSSCNLNLTTGQSNYVRISASNFKLSESNLVFLQCRSNLNPFLTNSITGLKCDTSNIILKNQNGSNYST
jgi:hypothetical protein